jgi:hypothetical protein
MNLFEKHYSYWKSAEASQLLEEATKLYLNSSQNDFIFKLKNKYSKNVSPDTLNIAIGIIIGRAKLKKLGYEENFQNGFYLTQQLEQASKPQVANYHASYFKNRNLVIEVCAGLGFDTLELSKVVQKVITIEADPLVASFLKLNTEVFNCRNIEVICEKADFNLLNKYASKADGIWADPDRRNELGQRVNSVYDASPSFKIFEELDFNYLIGVKVSAATSFSNSNWANEFIGIDSECKEQILWKNTDFKKTKVTLLDCNLTYFGSETELLEPLEEVKKYLLDPHATLLASNTATNFFSSKKYQNLKGTFLATSEEKPESSNWYQIFEIEECITYRNSDVNQIIKKLNWGSNTAIKKFGVSKSAEEIRKGLKFVKNASNNDHNNVIYVIKSGNIEIAVFAKRV